MRCSLFLLATCAALALPAPVHAADTGVTSAPPALAPESQAAERSGARPKIDQDANAELPAVVVNAIPGQPPASQIVQPVSVLGGVELDTARAATLGQTVAGVPGVQTSAFGAGAGRPVIRGLDGARVAILSGGLGSQDVSSVSQDHAVAIEPFLADQIEILKGPSTLLFGAGAIGGVVNVVDGRIPETAPANGLRGRMQVNRDSVSDGDTQAFRVDAGGSGFALHADGLQRDNADYMIPDGRLANSFVRTRAGALGGSWLGERGHLGISVSRYLDAYGNPAEPGDPLAHEPAVHVRMAQTRYELKGAIDAPFAGIDKAELSFGRTDYRHTEFEGDAIGTVFSNKANEGRLLLSHAAIGGWLGASGVQVSRRDFTAIGEESFVPPTSSAGIGLFVTGQKSSGPLKVDLGLRVDRQRSTPQHGAERDFRPYSLSGGFAWRFNEAWHLTLNLDRAQRAPAEEELFANGPHVASATFEVGDPELGKETANQAELGLHWHGEFVDAKVAAYINRYDDFIHLADTGQVEHELPVRLWSQADATFRGGEAEATFHLAKNASGHYDLRIWGDSVRATLDESGNVPRIPAARFGSELSWRNDDWRASVGVTRYSRQEHAAALETDTAGFTLLDAHLAWSFFNDERSSWEAFVDGNNLGNRTARLSTSLIKDLAPLPGRNVSIGLRALF